MTIRKMQVLLTRDLRDAEHATLRAAIPGMTGVGYETGRA